jgi:hypothetical protein
LTLHREKIEKSILEYTFHQFQIPLQHIAVEEMLLEQRKKLDPPVVSWKTFRTLLKSSGIPDESHIQKASQTLFELGAICYFQVDGLRDLVILNPQWLYETLTYAVQEKISQSSSGISVNTTSFSASIEKTSITVGWLQHSVFPTFPLELCTKILNIMDHTRISFHFPQADTALTPGTRRSVLYCLLESTRPPWFQFETKQYTPLIRLFRKYEFDFFPDDIVSGLIGRYVHRLFRIL